jgi:hypothetical protein
MKTGTLIRAFVFAVSLALPGVSAALEVGEKAPNFDLASTRDGKFSLASMAGKKAVIVQFYVLDFTPT